MKEKQKISIIMPVKNAIPFLTDCLISIQNQTETIWELIAIDDSSTDGSFSVLENFSKKDQRIKVFKNSSSGITPALKLGYEKSTGNLITRMDADDLMPLQKLELLRGQIELKKGVVATGLVEYFPKDKIRDGFKKYEIWLNNLTKDQANFSEIYKECVIPSPCWMMIRSDFEKIGGFNADTYPEDYDLCFRMFQNGIEVIGINQILHKWRDYPTRTSRTNPNYADNRFLDLKLKYFFKITRKEEQPLVLWGAGKKGKAVAKKLIDLHKEFRWIAKNKKKEGLKVYDTLIESITNIKQIKSPQILILVAGEDTQNEIIDFLKKNKFVDYYLFC